MISVTVASPAEALAAPWRDLVERANGNAFMNPAALKAAQDAMMAVITILLAWEVGAEPARLVGLWALQAKAVLPVWPVFLDAFPYPYAFISTPVVDPAHAERVMPAFFAAIAKDRRLPKVVWMQDLDAAGPVYEAVQRTVSDSGLARMEVKTRRGPVATREAGVKSSGSTRKKLRQDWNRLARLGALEVINDREPAAVAAALEQFLKLEMASWKGRGHTAILSSDRDAQFVRRFVVDMARTGEASVALLRLDGKPVAAQVLLYCGHTAFTWKPAYDEAYAKYSPGSLLVDRITTDLLAGDIERVDSCALEESFMGQLYVGRKPVVNLLVNAAPGFSPAFLVEAAHRRGYEMLRKLRDRVQHRRPRHAGPAPEPAEAP